MSLPTISLTGDAHSQGRQHGELLQTRIVHNIAVYFERFQREVDLSRNEARGIASRIAETIHRHAPEYYTAMQGVADGGGFDFLDIAALNVRYEILYYQFGKQALNKAAAARREPPVDGCTSFAVLPDLSENGHLLLGQNWDWIPEVQGAVVHTTDTAGFETLGYTEAGIVGTKIGLNSAKVGLCINGMTTTSDDWSRDVLPFHVRLWNVLRAPDFESAVAAVVNTPRAIAGNFLIAQTPNRVADLEVAPDTHQTLTPQSGLLTHANHFSDPDGLGINEPPNERRVYSRHRTARLYDLFTEHAPLSLEKIKTLLRDTQDEPFGICRHRNPAEPPEMHYVTVTSVVMDLDAQTIHLTDGPPDQSEYQTAAL